MSTSEIGENNTIYHKDKINVLESNKYTSFILLNFERIFSLNCFYYKLESFQKLPETELCEIIPTISSYREFIDLTHFISSHDEDENDVKYNCDSISCIFTY